jgi:hypothetical protein
MKSKIATLLGAALLCSTLAVQAQTTTPPAAGASEHKRPTPEQREKMHEAMKSAHEACKGKADEKACMSEQFCAKAEDKAKCQARVKERQEKMGKHMDQHQAMAEACTGKRGDDLKKCYHEQHEKSGMGKPAAK